MRVRTKILTLHELPSSGDVAQPRCMQVELQPNESATVTLVASHEQLSTAFADGTRSIVPGKRTVWVGGHNPLDAEATDKLVVGEVTLAAPTAGRDARRM